MPIACAVLLFFVGAQTAVTKLNGRPILAVDKLFTANFSGIRRRSGKEVTEVVIAIDRSSLKDVVPADLGDADSWWLWKGGQDHSGVVQPEARARPHHPGRATLAKGGDQVTLDVDADSFGLKSQDHLLVFLDAKRVGGLGPEAIVLSERGLVLNVVRPPPGRGVNVGGLGVALNEGLENGSTRDVVHATALFDDPAIVRITGNTKLHFVGDAVLSSAPTDDSAYVSGTLFVEKMQVLTDLLPTIPLSPFVRFDSSESSNNQAWTAGLQALVRLRGTQFGAPNVINASRDASLLLIPVEYQDWYRRADSVNPYLLRPDMLVSAAKVRWEPIYLFSPKEVPDIEKDYSLHLASSLWYFLDRQVAAGIDPTRFASRIDIELQIPFVKLGLQRRIKFPARLSISLGSGAEPWNGYIASTSFGIGVKTSF